MRYHPVLVGISCTSGEFWATLRALAAQLCNELRGVGVPIHHRPGRVVLRHSGAVRVDPARRTRRGSSPLRVALVSPPLHASGGIGTLMSYLLASLDQGQITVRHIDSRGQSSRPVLSVLPLLRAAVTLVALKVSRRVDVVHVNMSYRGSTIRKGALAWVCRTIRVPMILHLHTCEFEEFYRKLPSPAQRAVRTTFQRADHVIVLGNVWESFVVGELKVPAERVTVLYNAAPGPSEVAPRHAESVTDPVRLLFLGQLGARKGVPELLCALSRLRPADDWSITMAGDGDGGARALARELGIIDRVTFTGWLDSVQVHDLLESSDVLILPSHAEGLPMAIIEAFAYRVAVVASSVGAIPEIVKDRETGLLVPAGDLDALEQAIATLCHDTVLRDTLAQAGRKTWESCFEIESYTERLTEIWFKIAAGKNERPMTIHYEREDTDHMTGDEHDTELEVLSYSEAVERMTGSVQRHLAEATSPMRILEAGCGRRWELELGPNEYHLTGVDLDAHALEHRRTVTADLDVGVVGSVSDRDVVASNQFDLVYSAYVLEHLDRAEPALENFAAWASPGGLIVMMLPNRDSVYGWAARHTPYWFHVAVYRYLFGQRNAGKPGFSPYPTYHDPILGLKELAAFCEAHDLTAQEWFAIDSFAEREGLKYAAIRSAMRLVSRLSAGRLSDRAVDLGIVLRVPVG